MSLRDLTESSSILIYETKKLTNIVVRPTKMVSPGRHPRQDHILFPQFPVSRTTTSLQAVSDRRPIIARDPPS